MEKNNVLIADSGMISEFESLLCKIPGVISTKIVSGQSGNIEELHILADFTRNPKQIVRDVQSALAAKYDYSIDHKVISVAQIEDGKLSPREPRLILNHVRVTTEGTKAEVRVSLSMDDKEFIGVSTGGNSVNGRQRLVAEATLDAVHSFLDTEYTFVLADIQKVFIAGKMACIVTVGHISKWGEELLIGSSFIKQDENESVIKATLDSVNRRMGGQIGRYDIR